MKIAILTSNFPRHKYVINQIALNFDVCGIVMEEKKRDYSKKGDGTLYESQVKKYFEDRTESEKLFFGDFLEVKVGKETILEIPAGELNESYVCEKLATWKPYYIVVFGSSLLKEKIIDLLPPKRIINMHLGLSPYYRGSGTNFWALYNKEPQYVGVTIHYLDKGIDSGEIIVQGRPEIVGDDTPHSIGNKTIVVGVGLLTELLKKIEQGKEIKSQEQDLSIGKVYKFKDCEPERIIELMEKWDKGLIRDYLRVRKTLGDVKIAGNLNYGQ